MKILIITLGFIFSTLLVGAQAKNDLKGPAAKNYKPWRDKTEINVPTPVIAVDKVALKGPAAKNHKPWKVDSETEYVAIEIGSPRTELKGPAAKNYKPWKKSQDEYPANDTIDDQSSTY
ncbi:MAG: hypothetical protein ACI83W_000307 [Marinoscillum sp.]|jgi:hypothetical protein